jgi:hypothetical protein
MKCHLCQSFNGIFACLWRLSCSRIFSAANVSYCQVKGVMEITAGPLEIVVVFRV